MGVSVLNSIPLGVSDSGRGDFMPKETPNICKCGCLRPCGDSKYFNRHDRWQTTRQSPVDYIVEDRGYKTACWIWQLKITRFGYGSIKVNGSSLHAHKYYYIQYRGGFELYDEEGKRIELDHLCRVRPCVNPEHLEVVAQILNIRRGAVAKLCKTDLIKIKCLYRLGKSQQQIAELFSVSQSHIGRILSAKRWVGIVTPIKARRESNLKLSPEQVAEIRQCRKDGESKKSLAKRFDISRSHLNHIVSGHSWSKALRTPD